MAEQKNTENTGATTQIPSSDIKEESKDAGQDILEKYGDLLRPCEVYKGEYKECKSIRGRFNQYFIFGEYLDCTQWATDYNNCQKHSWLNDKEAAKLVIQSELNRRTARLKPHYDNDIWTKRENPPADWSRPLPDYMEERNKNTYLYLKNKEYIEEQEKQHQAALNTPIEANKSSFCTFM